MYTNINLSQLLREPLTSDYYGYVVLVKVPTSASFRDLHTKNLIFTGF